MEIFKQLNKKGYKHYYEGNVEELDSMDKDNQHLHSEIMQVIMWLYEKHGIWISVECDVYGKLWYAKFTVASKSLWENEDKRHEVLTSFRKFYNEHDTPTKAYEAAIKHTLNNLI